MLRSRRSDQPARVRSLVVTAIALSLVLATAGVSHADNDRTVTRNGQRMRVWITRNGNTFTCHATNTATGNSDTILVSGVCQYKWSGSWYDFEEAPYGRDNDGGAGVQYTDNPCTSADGPPDLTGGPFKIRAQADGWNSYGGITTEFGTPINTTIPYMEVNC
jgi:hypothetical protein